MATSTTNPDMEAGTLPAGRVAPPWPREPRPTDVTATFDNDLDGKPSHRDALQALLAFSALHEQVRRRKSLAARSNAFDTVGPESEFEAGEQFVLDEVLQLVAERAVAITGADGLAIALAENNEIVLRASAGTVRPDVGARVDRSSAFSGACFRTAQIVRCDDTELDPRVNLRACRRLGARSMVAVPLCGRRRVIGLLEAFSAEPFGFNESDVRNLSLLAELVLGALKPEDEDRFAESAQVAEEALKPAANPQSELIFERVVAKEPRSPVEPPIAEIVASAAPIGIDVPLAPARDFLPTPGVELETVDKLLKPEEANLPEVAVAEALPSTHRPGVLLVLALVVAATLLAAGLWWKLKNAQLGSAMIETPNPAAKLDSATGAVTPTKKTAPDSAPMTSGTDTSAGSNASQDALSEMGDPQNAAATPQELSKFPRVTGIRHWSSADSTTVVLDLEDQVQYEAHRLNGPDRIYFDLRDTALSQEVAGRSVDVGDTLLNRIRLAQPVPGMTRMVLETKGNSNFAVSLEPNPYRLVVQVRRIGANPKSAVNLFPNEVEAANRLAIVVPPPTREDLQLRARVPKMRIVVDAGHGGWDLGTVGRRGLLEKDLVLEIAQRLGKLLESRLGSEVIYTRQDDNYVPLDERAGIANQAQADLFVSVHANYSDLPSARGVETYYTNFFSAPSAKDLDTRENASGSKITHSATLAPADLHERIEQSRRLAASVQRSLYGILSAQNPGLRDRGIKEAGFVVLTETSMPGILAEVSFVSSPTDEQRLRSDGYREQIAEALYKGIARYAVNSHGVKVASVAK
jgi:N-acetylmuramoyl-L-alanine amidase/putative methionine-R-sulfoxide reductase with GAF domain